MSDELTEIVPIRRGQAFVPFSDEVRARAYVIYATMAAGNYAATARLLALELAGSDQAVPTRDTIRLWGIEDGWAQQAEAFWRHSPAPAIYEMQRLTVGSGMVAMQALHNILTGLDARPMEERVLALKAYELVVRTLEKLPFLREVRPPAAAASADEVLSVEEREARAQAAIVRRTEVS